MKKNLTESDYQRAIIDRLQIFENQGKLFFQRTNNNSIYDPVGGRFRALAKGQKKGFPDIMVLSQGRTIGLEVKSPTGRQSKEQKAMEEYFKKQGAEYYIVTFVEEVERIIND